MKQKELIKLGIVLLICIVLLGIAYLFYNKRKNSLDEWTKPNTLEVNPYQMQQVSSYSQFFSVVNDMNQYLRYLKNKDTKALQSLLHPDYINDKKINSSNLFQILPSYGNEVLLFKAKNMLFKTFDNVSIYFVEGNIYSDQFENINLVAENVYYLVIVDYISLAFAIYPLADLPNSLPIKKPNNSINLNNYNEIEGSDIVTDDYICNLYYSDFMNLVINNLEESYNVLDDDFRIKNYPKRSKYLEDMQSKKDKMATKIYSCVNESGNARVYTVKDMNYNTYTFTEESIMNYKVSFSFH